MLLLTRILCLISVISQNSESLMKQDEVIDSDILKQLKKEMKGLRQRIYALETAIDNLNTQCKEQQDDKLESFNFGDITASFQQLEQYKIATEVIDDKLQMYVRDTGKKRVYKNEFTSVELHQCGFTKFQVASLEKISKFISNAIKNTSDDIEFSIVCKKDTSLIKIVRHDSHFGDHIISMELHSIQRKPVDILMDHVIDLQRENENMKQNMNECNRQLSSITNTMSVVQSSINENIIEEINLKLINNWSQYAGWSKPKAYKQGKMIYLQGLVKGGSLGTVITQLPEGWRPDTHRIFCQNQDPAAARVDVQSNGNIIVKYGKHVTTWVPLDGIVFVMN